MSMGQRPPYETFTGPTCRGCKALGNNCGHCEKCKWEDAQQMAIIATNKSTVVQEFVEQKNREGHIWLRLFKNRSGQAAFTIYDPAMGIPTSTESMYLVSDMDSRGAILPRHMKVAPLFSSNVVGIEFDELTREEELLGYLEQAFEILRSARPLSK